MGANGINVSALLDPALVEKGSRIRSYNNVNKTRFHVRQLVAYWFISTFNTKINLVFCDANSSSGVTKRQSAVSLIKGLRDDHPGLEHMVARVRAGTFKAKPLNSNQNKNKAKQRAGLGFLGLVGKTTCLMIVETRPDPRGDGAMWRFANTPDRNGRLVIVAAFGCHILDFTLVNR